jgi:hypothetical protein
VIVCSCSGVVGRKWGSCGSSAMARPPD